MARPTARCLLLATAQDDSADNGGHARNARSHRRHEARGVTGLRQRLARLIGILILGLVVVLLLGLAIVPGLHLGIHPTAVDGGVGLDGPGEVELGLAGLVGKPASEGLALEDL